MKKILSVLLCLTLLAGVVAVGISPAIKASADTVVGVAAAEILNQDDQKPDGFDSAKDPYGLMGTSDEKLIMGQQEMFVSEVKGSSLYTKTGDNLKTTTGAVNFDTNSFNSAVSKEYAAAGIYYTKSTAFDKDGDGARESVAYIGWRQSDNQIVVWDVNAKTNTMSAIKSIGAACGGIGNLYKKAGSYRVEDTYQALNFFDITAGDFNGDGKESIIVAAPTTNSNSHSIPKLFELKRGDSELYISTQGYESYLNPAYTGGSIKESKDYEDLLSIQITSGDFNNDGKDDLAVVSYTNDISGTYDDEKTNTLYVPYLTAGYGSSAGLAGTPYSKLGLVSSYATGNDGGDPLYDIPIASNITCGDIDADGMPEIIVAGYAGKVINEGGEWSMFDSGRSPEQYYVLYYDANSGLAYKSWDKLTANAWTVGTTSQGIWMGSSAASDWVWQPLSVCTAALDGMGSKEYVFINGNIYQLGSGGLQLSHQPQYFNQTDLGIGEYGINVVFVSEVVSGVFDGNCNGREQFAAILGFKQTGTANYLYLPAIIGKTEVTTNGNSSMQFFCNNISGSQKFGNKYSAQTTIAAVDCDDDIIKVRYNDKSYAWSNPNVIGVLQAAPYFGELGSFDDFNDGSTTLSISTGYESEYTDTSSQSLGVGFAFELDLDVFELEFKIGYSGEWEESTFNSTSTSQSVSFTAGANDTVILKRTPVYSYKYDLWDATNNKWIENGHIIQIAKESLYYTLTIDEFNAFVDYYNSLMNSVYGKDFTPFSKITDTNAPSLHQEGNPYGYDDGTVGTMSVPLGHNGGSNAISYEESYGSGSSYSHSDGLSFELSAVAGCSEVKAGAYVDGEFMWGHEEAYTNVSGKETEGAVCNINNADIIDATGASAALVNQYSFRWSFGTWNLNLGGAGDVPVYGYNLKDISSPPPRVTDLEYDVENGGTELAFGWTEPEGKPGTSIVGYNLYMSVDGGEFTKVNSSLISDTEYTMNSEQFDRTKSLEFVVTSVVQIPLTTGGGSTLAESIFSNICNYNGNLIGKSAYEIAVEEGFTGTLEEWLESIRGENGSSIKEIKKTASDGLVDTYTITLTDGTTTEFFVTNGADGADGADGESAYETAKKNGYTGTQEQWLTLIGANCASGHNYTEFTIPATCGVNGLSFEVCGNCGSSEITSTPSLEHSYTDTIINPTCHTKGYTMHKCENCDNFYIDSETDFADHTMATKVITNSCYADGYTISYCTVCGYTEYIDETAKLSHNFTETVTDPTCISTGYTTYECSECGYKYIDNITEPVGHNFTETVTNPTCTSVGYTTFECTGCGSKHIDNITETAGHNFKETVTDPTCTTTGFTVYKCETCGEQYTDSIQNALAHNFVKTVTDPTCNANGYTVYKCSDCDEQYISDFTPMKSHTYDESIVTDPTCVKEGYTIHICKDCGASMKDSILPAQGHESGKWICENPTTGLYVQRCQKCYALLAEKTINIKLNSGNSDSGEGTSVPVEPGSEVSIKYGESTSFVIDTEEENVDVVYTSSNPSVAIVDENGNIKSVGAGTAIITATVPGTDATAEISINVKMTWWQKVHKLLDSIIIFRAIFMILGMEV